jgi:arsenate reductase (glutaredoxin)
LQLLATKVMIEVSFMAKPDVLMLSYANCSTCKNALAWLKKRGIEATVRDIVVHPPTMTELTVWIPRSGRDVRKWLNTSGQSYRALGKDAVLAASDRDVTTMLSKDGKLVKRPVLVYDKRVLCGFREEEYETAFG